MEINPLPSQLILFIIRIQWSWRNSKWANKGKWKWVWA